MVKKKNVLEDGSRQQNICHGIDRKATREEIELAERTWLSGWRMSGLKQNEGREIKGVGWSVVSGQLFEEQWMELKKLSGKEEKRDDSTESKKTKHS